MKILYLLCLALLMNLVQYLLTVQIVYLVQKQIILSMFVDNCSLLNYNEVKQLQQILILVHLLHFYLDQHFSFVLLDSFIVSGDNNSNLYPVFIVKTIVLNFIGTDFYRRIFSYNFMFFDDKFKVILNISNWIRAAGKSKLSFQVGAEISMFHFHFKCFSMCKRYLN